MSQSGWLPGVTQAPSGNHGGKFTTPPQILVMHFTASSSAAGSISWLRTPAAMASAHFVVDQAGAVTQLVPIDTIAWHAGKSALRDLRGLNQYSLGIELVNPGPCTLLNGKWYAGGHEVPQPFIGVHKNGGPWTRWTPYPQAQIDAAVALAKSLPGIDEIVGHDDIAPGRKIDVGPAFPMDAFRTAVLGV